MDRHVAEVPIQCFDADSVRVMHVRLLVGLRVQGQIELQGKIQECDGLGLVRQIAIGIGEFAPLQDTSLGQIS